MALVSITAKVVGLDQGGTKPGPSTASIVRSSAMFMCGASADVLLPAGVAKTTLITILSNHVTMDVINDCI